MNRPLPIRALSPLAARLLAAGMLTPGMLKAADGTWTTLAGGSWGTATNWSGSTLAAGTDAIADFSTLNITATATVTLDGARTVGTLKFGDSTTVSNDWVLNTGTGGPLTLDVTSGLATVNLVNRNATIGAAIAGTDGLNLTVATAGSTLILSGANTYTGGPTVTSGILQLNSPAAAGPASNVISIPASSTTFQNKVTINGGVTIPQNIVVAAGANGLSGRGVVEQVGTGQAIVNGAITLNGGTTAGGHFLGGAAVGNELVLAGPITSTVQVAQRAGRVVYAGGGTGYNSLSISETGLVGATNGIPVATAVVVGTSASATLDLNGFDQTLASLVIGSNANTGTVNLGANTLTLNGNLTSNGTGATANVINATTGTIDFGSTTRTISVADTTAVDDLTINSATLKAPAGLSKTTAGTLALNNVTITGPLNIAAGNLTIGKSTTTGTLTTTALSIANGTGINFNAGPGGDVINTGALTVAGTTTLRVTQSGGALPVGTYPLINYTGTSPGLGAFVLPPVGHASASLVDSGTAISLSISANDKTVWDGAVSSAWSTSVQNWKLLSTAALTNYAESDEVIFQDSATTSAVDIATAVSPSQTNFTNTTATTYTVTGAAGIGGGGGLTKTGNGAVILREQNTFTGPTVVSAGSLELDHDATGNLVLTGTSGVSVAAGSTLKLTRDDGPFTFNRAITGSGNVSVLAHSISGSATAHSITLSGNNAGFNGNLTLEAPLSGTYRIVSASPANIGNAIIDVKAGSQLYTTAQTYNNAISIAGAGFADASGNIGALRLEPAANWAGPIFVDDTAKIGCHSGTATISGPISGGETTFNATNYNNSYTLLLTGANSYAGTTIGGLNTQTAGVPTMRLNVGNGGTTGTLGAGPVTINGDGANGALGFDRSDGYTLAAGQTLTGGGSNLTRTFIDIDTTGTGFDNAGNAITLGTPTSGGFIRVGQTRANALANLSGNISSGSFYAGSAFKSVTNIQTGAVVTTGTLNVTRAPAADGSTLNILAGATLNADYLTEGESSTALSSGIVNAAGTVNVTNQLRVGHFNSETSTYNMTAGTLTMMGVNALNFPYTAAAGAANTVGDNNLNGGAAATLIVGGGIYLGIDGTGIFNQSGGTVSTNWLVLDNRTNTDVGAGMPSAVDTYNLTAGTLQLKSSYGIISRNATAAVNLDGGTVQAATGVSPNLDSNKISVGGNVTFDTNGANAFSLYGPLAGAGSIAVTGSGTFATVDGGAGTNVTVGGTMPGGSLSAVSASVAAGSTLQSNRSGVETWSGNISGAGNLVKQNTGLLTLTGAGASFTGAVLVNAGKLAVPSTFGSTSITVADGATFSGEPTTNALTLGTSGTSTLVIDPATAGALTTTSLVANGTVNIELSGAPGLAPITVVKYTSKSGAGTFALANPAAYRGAVITDTGSSIVVTFAPKDLIWTGSGGNLWDLSTTTSWNSGIVDSFFQTDKVTFDDTAPNTAVNVALTGLLNPSQVLVNSSTNNYSFTSSAGNQIGGGATLIKQGSSTLTLAGPNSYSGITSIQGGTVSINSSASIGDGSPTNTIALSNGGTLRSSATLDLGVNRLIDVGGGGGKLAEGTGLTMTIPGKISGTEPLGLTGGGVFILGAENTGFSGNVTVDSVGATSGASTLRLTNSKALNSGTLTLVQPAAPSATGSATGLDLNNVALSSNVSLVMNSLLSGTTSFRSQVTTSGGLNSVNGPVSIIGNAHIQFSSNGTNALALNGNISAAGSGYTGIVFLRGTGTGTLNGVVNAPDATFSKTDAATWTINSTGNNWLRTDVVSTGGLKLGIDNGLPIGSLLNIGQASDNAASLLDLNGFSQEIAALTYTAGTGNSNRAITNTNATLQSTFTVNNPAAVSYGASTGITGGLLTGNLRLVKNGAGSLNLGGVNTFTGSIVVNDGSLSTSASSGGLGSFTTAGRTITVNNGKSLALNALNVFGNGVANANLPAIILNDGATLTGNRYNSIGALTLNGSTLTSAHGSSDSTTYQSWQLKGAVTVGGNAVSTISGAGDFPGVHLDTNSVFNVADATTSPAADLVVSAGLLNQSLDNASVAGGLTKTGAGTMQLTAVGSYTGPTIVSAGTLLVDNDFSSNVTVSAGAVLGGNGSIAASVTASAAGSVIAPGDSIGTLTVVGNVALGGSLAVEINDSLAQKSDKLAVVGTLNLSNASITTTVTGAAGQAAYIIASYDTLSGTFATAPAGFTVDYAYNDGASTKNIALIPSADAYTTWAAGFGLDPLTDGLASFDKDNDGVPNGIEFVLGTNPKVTNDAATLPSVTTTATDVVFTFRRTDGSVYLNPHAQKSTSMTTGNWTDITTGVAVDDEFYGAGIDRVTVTIPKGTEPRIFVRLKVTTL